LLLIVVVHAADVQDRLGVRRVLRQLRAFPKLLTIFANGGSSG
jgi:hypothetical protein